jgi:hypothetical protein
MKLDQADSQLASLCAQIAAAADEAADWVNANSGVIGVKSHALNRDLRQQAELARKEQRAASRPLCFGVFGPSQAGKSYLISTLARKGTNPLVALLDQEYDFLREIGPEKKQEATGLVTRFTIHSTNAPKSHPVAVRLLNQIDLVKILANTYMTDFKPTEEHPPSDDEISKALKEARTRMRTSANDGDLKDIHIEGLRLYCENSFSGRKTIESLKSGYWTELEELAPQLDINDRVALYSFLWGRIPELTKVYVELYAALRSLGFAEEAYCAIDALVPRNKSILDVDTLSGMLDPKGETVEVLGKNGRSSRLLRPYLTAIVAELLIQIKEQPRDYSSYTDILDFPGARSRKLLDDPENFVKGDGAISGLFLRGKVAYLFHRYCENNDFTGMILCTMPGPQEVQTLPDMVLDWIHRSHGTTAEGRKDAATALFFVFTKFDLYLPTTRGTVANTAAEIEETWTAAIKKGLVDFYGKNRDAWPNRWKMGEPFNNCFWVRSPEYPARNIFQYDAAGTTELALLDSDRIAKQRDGYLASDMVRTHFRNPTDAWNAALTFNDGGNTYLADALGSVCKPDLKRNQVSARLEKLRVALVEKLQEFHTSDDGAVEARKREASARRAMSALANVFDDERFGHLLSELQIDSNDLQSLFARTKLTHDAKAPSARRRPSALAEWLGATPAKDEVTPAEQRDRYSDLATVAMSHWADKLQTLARQPQILDFFQLEPDTIETMARELLSGSERVGLSSVIAREIRATNPEMDETLKPALVAAERINRYVWKLGEDALPLSDRASVQNKGNAEAVFKFREPIGNLDELPEINRAYLLLFAASWLNSFVHLTQLNANDGSDRRFTTAEAERLAGIMGQIGG